jgi:hypothetical protein
MMKIARAALPAFALIMAMALCATAQDKDGKQDESAPRSVKSTPIKVTITFAEFEGEKKLKSLPYVLVVAPRENPPPSYSKLRMGSRVPVYTGKENGMQYLDIGSNIDCQASRLPDGTFDLRLGLDRSWVEGDVPVPVEKTQQASSGQFPEPVIRQFRSDLNLIMRDGQSVESTFATDPLSGKLFKVEVNLNVINK